LLNGIRLSPGGPSGPGGKKRTDLSSIAS